MADDASPNINWTITTFEGNRHKQHEAFLALPFREKIKAIESLGEVTAWFASRHSLRQPNIGQGPTAPSYVPRTASASPCGFTSSNINTTIPLNSIFTYQCKVSEKCLDE